MMGILYRDRARVVQVYVATALSVGAVVWKAVVALAGATPRRCFSLPTNPPLLKVDGIQYPESVPR